MRWDVPARSRPVSLRLAAVVVGAVVVMGVGASSARADAVLPGYEPPRCVVPECPAGTLPYGAVGHGTCGEGCILPPECGEPESCGPQAECRAMRLCVVPQLRQGRALADTVFGECAPDGSCARGECVVARRCASTRPSPPPRAGGSALRAPSGGGVRGGGACAVQAGRNPRGALLALVGAGLLAGLARRGRRSRGASPM